MDKQTQTYELDDFEELLDYKNRYNELNLQLQEMVQKYQDSQDKFDELKVVHEQTPVLYQRAYYDSLRSIRKMSRAYYELNVEIKELKNQ